jgi:ABC-type multidrug transport system ATPase subunit
VAQASGSVTYNGYGTDEFVVQRTAAYVDQQDNHIAELTVSSALLPIFASAITMQLQATQH